MSERMNDTREAEALIAEFRKARDPQAIRPSSDIAVSWANRIADAYEALAAERDSLAAALTEAQQQAWEFADAMEKQKQFALDQINARDAALTETQQELVEARHDFANIADVTPHVQGCDYPDDPTCAACIAKSAVARADEFLAALADVSGSEGESPVSG